MCSVRAPLCAMSQVCARVRVCAARMHVVPTAGGGVTLNILADTMLAEVFVHDRRGEGAEAITSTYSPEAACFGAAVFHVAQEGTGSRAKADIDVALQVWPIGSTL